MRARLTKSYSYNDRNNIPGKKADQGGRCLNAGAAAGAPHERRFVGVFAFMMVRYLRKIFFLCLLARAACADRTDPRNKRDS